ncbi:MAG TPA: hypothetical protein VFD58_16130 [Blastocatellia bacterium]|nr:hypothetical protein [Blastocatellia bacterium]
MQNLLPFGVKDQQADLLIRDEFNQRGNLLKALVSFLRQGQKNFIIPDFTLQQKAIQVVLADGFLELTGEWAPSTLISTAMRCSPDSSFSTFSAPRSTNTIKPLYLIVKGSWVMRQPSLLSAFLT